MTFTVKKKGDHWTVNGHNHGKVGDSIYKMGRYLRIGFSGGTISHHRRGHQKFVESGYMVYLYTILDPLQQMREVNDQRIKQGVGYENTTPYYQLTNMRVFEDEQQGIH